LRQGLKMPLIFALYVLAVILVSLLPSGGVSPWHVDNIGHFLAYTGMAVLACLTFNSGIARVSALFFAIALGVALEWGQSFVPGRDMSLLDGVANSLGVLSGTVLFRLRGRHFARYVERFIEQ
jgi:VanZ family protein